jgi:hypothetical protein
MTYVSTMRLKGVPQFRGWNGAARIPWMPTLEFPYEDALDATPAMPFVWILGFPRGDALDAIHVMSSIGAVTTSLSRRTHRSYGIKDLLTGKFKANSH